jgi:hypothetical protein
MPEYSRPGAAGPRFVPADEGRDRANRPRVQPVARPARGAETRRGPAGARGPEAFRPRSPRDPGQRPGPRDAEPTGRPAGVRLTGRGAVLCLLIVTFFAILASGWIGTGVLADVLFVAACGAMAWYAKPSDLLTVSVSPPLAFFFACVLDKLITSSGGTVAVEGTLVTLATSAPWLFAGTALTIAVGLRRGLLGNIRELRRGLQGDPGGKVARADERAPRR